MRSRQARVRASAVSEPLATRAAASRADSAVRSVTVFPRQYGRPGRPDRRRSMSARRAASKRRRWGGEAGRRPRRRRKKAKGRARRPFFRRWRKRSADTQADILVDAVAIEQQEKMLVALLLRLF